MNIKYIYIDLSIDTDSESERSIKIKQAKRNKYVQIPCVYKKIVVQTAIATTTTTLKPQRHGVSVCVNRNMA